MVLFGTKILAYLAAGAASYQQDLLKKADDSFKDLSLSESSGLDNTTELRTLLQSVISQNPESHFRKFVDPEFISDKLLELGKK